MRRQRKIKTKDKGQLRGKYKGQLRGKYKERLRGKDKESPQRIPKVREEENVK